MVLVGIGLASAAAGALVWRLARGRVKTDWLLLACSVGALTGLVATRIAQIPETSRSGRVEQAAAAIVVLAWWLVIRGAMRDRARNQKQDNDGGRWHLD